MTPIEQHIRNILNAFTLSELLELMEIDEQELVLMLLEDGHATLPEFFNLMEDNYDGDLYMEDEAGQDSQ